MAGSDKTVKVTLVAVAQPYAKGMAEASSATQRLSGDIDKVATKSKGLESGLGKASGAMKGLAVAGGALAGTAVVAFLGDAVKAAGDLEQSVGGVDAVFKKSAGSIHEFGQNAAESVGLSRNEFNELITVTGAMLKNKGLEDFAQKSLDLVKIGADLSATYGGSAKDAVEALNAAMRGESDPIERYGISLNETAVNAELAKKGLNKLTGAALEQAKAQARIDIITRQSADAMGKFAAESDTLQGQQQRLNAQWEDAKAQLGQALLPALTSVTQAMRGGVDVVLAAVHAWQSLPGPTQAAVAALIAFRVAQGPLTRGAGLAIDVLKSLREALGYAGASAARAGGGFKGLSAGFKTFTGGAGMAAGAMNGMKSAGSALMGLAGGPWGLAITGLTVAITGYFQAQENARKAGEAFADTLDKQTTAFTTQSRQLATESFFKDFAQEDYSKVSAGLEKAGVGIADLVAAYEKGGPAVADFKAKFDAFRESDPPNFGPNDLEKLGNAYAAVGRDIERGTEIAKVNADTQDKVAEATSGAGGAAAEAAARMADYTAKSKTLNAEADKGRTLQRDLASAMLAVKAAAGDADAAAINYQQSLDAATKSVKDNGRTLDINTEKGRANKSALLTLKDAALASAEANLKNGDSVGKVKGQMDTARESFVKVAMQMNGGNRKAAEALATKYGLTADAVDELKGSMDKIPKQVVSQLKADKAKADATIAKLKAELAALKKEYVINLRVNRIGASLDAGDVVGGRGGSGTKRAGGGPIYGPGTATSDSIPAMLSNGEYVIRAAAVAKYGTRFFDRANNMRLASGGPVQKFASGGSVRAPLDQFYDDFVTGLGEKVSAADLVANRKAIADATNKLRLAEMKLDEDRRKKKRNARQIAADEMAVAKARGAVASATRNATAAQQRYNAQQGSALSKFGKGVAAGVKNTTAFVYNIEKLASRGYVSLAQQLAGMNNADAERIAAEAANASTGTLNSLNAQVNAATTQQNKLDHIDTVAAIIGQLRTKNLTARQMAAATGIDVMEILDATAAIAGELRNNKNASKLLADLAKRSKGQLFSTGGHVTGPGSGTSDSIPAWLSNGEYVVKASAVSRYGRGFFDALNGMRFASGGLVSRMPANVTATLSPEALARMGAGDQITLNAYGMDADAAVRKVQRDHEFRRMSRLG